MGLVVQAPIRGWRSIGQLGLPKRRMAYPGMASRRSKRRITPGERPRWLLSKGTAGFSTALSDLE
jgi:hypothetical protein